MSSVVRVRFAPSPTGSLHLGGLRTALINYLFAKNQKGRFIVRIEDTDTHRSEDRYIREQLQDLKNFGLSPDEGPCPLTLEDKGDRGPYRQSQRLDIYRSFAQKLVQKGRAYEEASRQGEGGGGPVLRFKNFENKKHYTFQDVVRGRVSLPSDMVGDFVLLRSSGLPVYNFSCAVDDHLMGMTHVFRSEEHLPNTLRQLMIYEALGVPPPCFGHLSLILGEDRQKLSKRKGAFSVSQYMEKGYLPFALLNFLALQGWNPKTSREVFNFPDLVQAFSLKGLNAKPAVFDDQKLRWMNRQHLEKLSDADLLKKLQTFFQDRGWGFPEEGALEAVQVLREGFSTLQEARDWFSPLLEDHFKVENSAEEVLNWPLTPEVLKAWKAFLLQHTGGERVSKEEFLSGIKSIQKQTRAKGKFLFMPIRSAVLGRASGVELKLLVPLISKSTLVKRVGQLESSASSKK